jgi:type I restriction enzyme M protein
MLTLAFTATRPQAGVCLKMADERSRPPLNGQMSQASPIPAAYAWPALRALDADALFDHDRHTLEALGRQPGTLALIFGKAQSKFREAKLRPGDGSQLLAAGGRT